MAIITLVQSLCLGSPPVKPAAKTPLELCTLVAGWLIGTVSSRILRSRSLKQTYDKHKHGGAAPLVQLSNWSSINLHQTGCLLETFHLWGALLLTIILCVKWKQTGFLWGQDEDGHVKGNALEVKVEVDQSLPGPTGRDDWLQTCPPHFFQPLLLGSLRLVAAAWLVPVWQQPPQRAALHNQRD